MKVIVAGLSKTGTKSMALALRELGYNVYDYMENMEYLHNEWLTIFEKGGTAEDFRRMYKDVDAVTDIPPAFFWEEIHQAYPDAKVGNTAKTRIIRFFNSLQCSHNSLKCSTLRAVINFVDGFSANIKTAKLMNLPYEAQFYRYIFF